MLPELSYIRPTTQHDPISIAVDIKVNDSVHLLGLESPKIRTLFLSVWALCRFLWLASCFTRNWQFPTYPGIVVA